MAQEEPADEAAGRDEEDVVDPPQLIVALGFLDHRIVQPHHDQCKAHMERQLEPRVKGLDQLDVELEHRPDNGKNCQRIEAPFSAYSSAAWRFWYLRPLRLPEPWPWRREPITLVSFSLLIFPSVLSLVKAKAGHRKASGPCLRSKDRSDVVRSASAESFHSRNLLHVACFLVVLLSTGMQRAAAALHLFPSGLRLPRGTGELYSATRASRFSLRLLVMA